MAHAKRGKVTALATSPVDAIRDQLHVIWGVSAQDEQTEQALMHVWNAINTIEQRVIEDQRVKQAQGRMIDELRGQRDAAIAAREQDHHRSTAEQSFWRRRGEELARRELVGLIADTVRCGIDDVELLLLGMEDNTHNYRDLNELKGLLKRLARNADGL